MDVLIVEDDDAMAGALTAAVESAGHHPQRLARAQTRCCPTGTSR